MKVMATRLRIETKDAYNPDRRYETRKCTGDVSKNISFEDYGRLEDTSVIDQIEEPRRTR